MSALRNFLNKIKPSFQEGGKLHAFRSVFDGFEQAARFPLCVRRIRDVHVRSERHGEGSRCTHS